MHKHFIVSLELVAATLRQQRCNYQGQQMIEKVFGLLAVACAAIQFIPYIYDTLKGHTQPQRAAWLIWFALGGVIFFTQLAEGARASLWVTCMHMTGNLTIFLLAIKRGYGRFTKRDAMSLGIAGLGLILWALTKQPTIALIIAIGVDSIGAALVATKAYRDPHSETLSTWVFAGLAGLCATFAVGSLQQPILLAYPLYVVLNCSVTSLTIIFRKRIVPRLQELEEELEREIAVGFDMDSEA